MRATLLLGLALGVLFLPAAAPAEDDFTAAKKRFESAFRPDKPAKDRLDSVFEIGTFDTRDAAKLLVKAIRAEDLIVAPLVEEKEKLDDEIQRILEPHMLDKERKITGKPGQDLAGELRRKKRRSSELTERLDTEHKVFEEIEASLARLMNVRAIEWLGKTALLSDKHWRARLIAARALLEIGNESTHKPLVSALSDKDVRVKVTAAQAVGKLKIAAGLKPLLKLLDHKNWTVRAAAIEALGDIGEKGAVGPLIKQIDEEEGRLREDCAQALAKLTGMRFGQAVGQWKKWWEEHKQEYGGDDGKRLGGHGKDESGDAGKGYYGIPVVTGKAIFILDVSGSMSKSSKDSSRDPAKGEISKVEQAKRELTRAVKNFTSKGKFNLIIFNDIVKSWRETMVPATKKNKAEAMAWVKDLTAASSTNIYDALHKAFKIAGMGVNDRHYRVEADTIFLLSDGSPTKPTGEADDWQKILRAVREWNKLKKVTIHTIGIGNHNMAFMSQLAAENNGKYVSR